MGYKSDIKKADRTQEASDFPMVVLIDNTNACNLRCSMCDHHNMRKYRKIQTLDFDLYTRIIDEIALERPDARVWQIFFGDPFLCKDMPKRIKYAKDKGLTDVVLNTNGMLMTPEKGRAIIESGLDAMYVGVDAHNPETYKQIRVGGDYHTTVANVLAYRDNLEKYGTAGQRLFVQFVVSDINEDQVEDFKAFWGDAGVAVKIRPKLSWAGLVEATNLRANESVQRKPCYWLMRTINICADGRVALCSIDVHCRVPSGDVRTASIKELWQNGPLQKYRRLHLDGDFDELPEMCRQCTDWQSGYAEFHDPKPKNETCHD